MSASHAEGFPAVRPVYGKWHREVLFCDQDPVWFFFHPVEDKRIYLANLLWQ
jgi:hypothetical protein